MREIMISQSNQIQKAVRLLRTNMTTTIGLNLPAGASEKVAAMLAPKMKEGVGFSLYLTATQSAVFLHLTSNLDSGVLIENRWNEARAFYGQKELTDLVALIKSVHH